MQPQLGEAALQPQPAFAAALQPQLGAAAAHPFEQPLLQHDVVQLGLQHLLQENKLSNSPGRQRCLQQVGLQQVGLLQHDGAALQPQLGAAAALLQPQEGEAAAAQPAAALLQPQLGAAAAAHPPLQPLLQPDEQPVLQVGLQHRPPRFKFSLRQQVVRSQQGLQEGLQQAGAALQPQLGPAAAAAQQEEGAAAAAQLGPASQQLFAAQPLLQPQPFTPSIRSSKSKPKLWVQRLKPSTIDPNRMFNFIEPRLLNGGTCLLVIFSHRLTRACLSPTMRNRRRHSDHSWWFCSRSLELADLGKPVAGRWVVTRSSRCDRARTGRAIP